MQEELAATLDKETSNIDKIKAIFEENISGLEATKLLDVFKGNISIINEKYNMVKQCSKINNIVAWVIVAIKEDYKKLRK